MDFSAFASASSNSASATTTSASTTASSAIEIKTEPIEPRTFPRLLPAEGINTSNFECGFEEKFLKCPMPTDLFNCVVCSFFPRAPCQIASCGHIGCEFCLAKYFKKNARPGQLGMPSAAPCPKCRKPFRLSDLNDRHLFNNFDSLLYKSIELKCPNGCGNVGNWEEIDNHEAFYCPLRTLACPNIGCDMVMPAEQLEMEHFPQCKFFNFYCPKCLLPVAENEMREHGCIAELQNQVTRMSVL